MANSTVDAIAKLNDLHRQRAESYVLGPGIIALPAETVAAIILAVRTYDSRGIHSNSSHEHGCGVVEVDGVHVQWKIDYYDPSLGSHSADPSDESVTRRVLSIMLSDQCQAAISTIGAATGSVDGRKADSALLADSRDDTQSILTMDS